jgi:hypothetical protein
MSTDCQAGGINMHGIEATDQQQFEHVVERLRVRAGQGNDRQNVAQVGQDG